MQCVLIFGNPEGPQLSQVTESARVIIFLGVLPGMEDECAQFGTDQPFVLEHFILQSDCATQPKNPHM